MPNIDNMPPRGPGAIIPAAILEVLGVLFVIIALALTVIDMGGRWFFQSPLRVASDLTEQLIPIVAFLGLAATFAGASAAIAWPPRDRAASPARYWSWFGPAVGMLVLGAVAARYFTRSSEARKMEELSMTTGLPLAPFFSTAAFCAVLAAIVAAVAVVRAMMRLAPLAPKDPELDI